ncbi:leucyl/phenylalanyl-tRNA--protein transferase [Spelaeicoccus albus]|uniref:Leucyl/phenylalanyl-tRNA--protein transferase n=1 Tax=Spelaeicoccus albus TaxID=1280376 RepID=A0A7Z0D3X1_9MICO|nr:leucyl/phenylalanyl-tRNA--protein transferase [Spelaeicoccus albus]NYI68341.1 leucyl/phenylalanyl-tRNA--protein transferase [Spelaeicoccus albus]
MDVEDLRAVGTELDSSQVLSAYRAGLFPMGLGDGGGPPMGWWFPVSRGIIDLEAGRRPRSLRRARAKFDIRVDTAFPDVLAACADPARPGRWISDRMIDVYTGLHEAGWAHSVEAWDDSGLAGGLYGIGIGGFFAGESMFHWRTDASKAAVAGLVDIMCEEPGGPDSRLVDVQWTTPHLKTIGAVDVTRQDYLARLRRALRAEPPTRLCR